MAKKAKCPKCLGEMNEGAVVCYTCKKIVDWYAWYLINWKSIVSIGIVFLLVWWSLEFINGCHFNVKFK
jgi:hypothetical protein